MSFPPMYQSQQLNYMTVNSSGALNIVYSPEVRLTGNLMSSSELANPRRDWQV